MKRLTVVVIGEGRDERGPPRANQPFQVVPHEQQGAMEILIRRKLYGLLRAPSDREWHAGLDDGIDILQAPPTREAMVEVLADPKLLGLIVASTLKPVRGRPRAALLVATHDAEDGAATETAVATVNASFGTQVPLLQPNPELQAWLTSKRAVERVYGHEHCTVPEVDEDQLRRDAKQELKRLLAAHADVFSAERQARLAEVVAIADVRRFSEWNAWDEADSLLTEVLVGSGVL